MTPPYTTPDYTQWQDDPTDVCTLPIVLDYAAFSGESVDDIVHKMASFKEYTKAEFNNDSANFYASSQTYIYDLLNGNLTPGIRANILNKFLPHIIEEIKKSSRTNFW
jgi:hypothetical protein